MTLLNLSYPVSWVARLKETLDPNNFSLFSKISKNDDVFLTFFWIGLFSFFEIVTNGHGKSVDLFFFRYIGIGVDLKEKKIFNPILCHWSLSIPPVFRGYGEIPVAWSGSLKAAVSRLFQNKSFETPCRIHKRFLPIPACFCNKVALLNPEFIFKGRPRHRCFSVILVKVLRALRVATSYSSGRYPKTYLDTILKGSNDINWGNISDFNANIEHVFVYYDNFGGRHPE